MPDIVLTRLLGEAAHRHVLDHARAQRADAAIGKIGEHRGSFLEQKVAGPSMLGDRMPQSSRPTAHRLADCAPAVTRAPPARAGSFSAPFSDLAPMRAKRSQ